MSFSMKNNIFLKPQVIHSCPKPKIANTTLQTSTLQLSNTPKNNIIPTSRRVAHRTITHNRSPNPPAEATIKEGMSLAFLFSTAEKAQAP
jgi:hypothetical protein